MTKRVPAAGTASGVAPQTRYPKRLSRLLEAAVSAQGNLQVIGAALRVSGRVLGQRLSALRTQGVARKVRLYDPRRLGRPCEVIALVQLRAYERAQADRFEQSIRADRAITGASRIIGAFDYQLFAFHADLRCAERWARDLEGDEVVARVRLTPVRTVYGDGLAGMVLHTPCPPPPDLTSGPWPRLLLRDLGEQQDELGAL